MRSCLKVRGGRRAEATRHGVFEPRGAGEQAGRSVGLPGSPASAGRGGFPGGGTGRPARRSVPGCGGDRVRPSPTCPGRGGAGTPGRSLRPERGAGLARMRSPGREPVWPPGPHLRRGLTCGRGCARTHLLCRREPPDSEMQVSGRVDAAVLTHRLLCQCKGYKQVVLI